MCSFSSKIENKKPRPSNQNVLDNHKRPSSHESTEISPDIVSLILSHPRPIKPIQPTKMEVKPQQILSTPPLSNQKQVFGFNFPNFFEPQQVSPVSIPMNEPIQVINDRFYSPIYESKIQENVAFFQNSKLHKFFHSPHYIQNIYGKLIANSDIDDNVEITAEMTDSPVIDGEPVVGLVSPLTKEAIWYKDYLNKKKLRNSKSIFVRDY